MLQFFLAVSLVFISAAVVADNPATAVPRAALPAIALIIDDLGNRGTQDERVIQLPGPVACAFLPHAPFTASLAIRAHRQNKEVLLHLPMQADGHERSLEEQGVLTQDMTRQQFLETLQHDLGAVPHVSGLNNHMGSLLTRHFEKMVWLMQSIRKRGSLFFVDSRTTGVTLAGRLARIHSIPTADRNVFLDNDQEPEAIRAQFRLLLDTARRQGTALGIGHPHAATLQILREEIDNLHTQGIALMPVAHLIELQNRRDRLWQASLSR